MAAAGIEPVYVQLGERIAQLRRDRELTQERLAVAAGVSTNYLARVEGGQHRATLPKLEQIAGALDVAVGVLFGAAEGAPAPILTDLRRALGRLSREDQRLVLKVVERFAVGGERRSTKKRATRARRKA